MDVSRRHKTTGVNFIWNERASGLFVQKSKVLPRPFLIRRDISVTVDDDHRVAGLRMIAKLDRVDDLSL
jgi:hypothetical protein